MFSRGQTLLELVVVISVVVIVVGALTFATIAAIRNASFAQNQLQATKLAQEGIELVRTGRDRNRPISITGVSTVDSWSGTGPIWNYHISGDCDRPELTPPGLCYFNIDSTGQLANIGFASTSFPQLAEGVPSTNPIFRRVILLSDDASFASEKKVISIVKWTDFAGEHESRLTTVLTKK